MLLRALEEGMRVEPAKMPTGSGTSESKSDSALAAKTYASILIVEFVNRNERAVKFTVASVTFPSHNPGVRNSMNVS